ncbi:hypothetical protein [Mucilaginibacter conchicola]|uniref:hypothetical protein n=1 Tax=Mucilaginibacter conchicola TaxID=2303333 RepID=UPI0013142637|nr:hypothetical protein [Mucilaginibacter conchicola]
MQVAFDFLFYRPFAPMAHPCELALILTARVSRVPLLPKPNKKPSPFYRKGFGFING